MKKKKKKDLKRTSVEYGVNFNYWLRAVEGSTAV